MSNSNKRKELTETHVISSFWGTEGCFCNERAANWTANVKRKRCIPPVLFRRWTGYLLTPWDVSPGQTKDTVLLLNTHSVQTAAKGVKGCNMAPYYTLNTHKHTESYTTEQEWGSQGSRSFGVTLRAGPAVLVQVSASRLNNIATLHLCDVGSHKCIRWLGLCCALCVLSLNLVS